MNEWVPHLVEAGALLLTIGVTFGMLRSRLVGAERAIVDLKTEKASNERVQAMVDRIDRFERDVLGKLGEIGDELRELRRDLKEYAERR